MVDLKSWQRGADRAARAETRGAGHRQQHRRRRGGRLGLPAYEAIIRKAQRISADLLVVENHHGTGKHPARWLLAHGLGAAICPIPVLLGRTGLYHRRVLAAVDPSHVRAKPANLDRQIRRPARSWCTLHGEAPTLCMRCCGVADRPAMPDGPLIDLAEVDEFADAAS